jgi:hypothetical protein
VIWAVYVHCCEPVVEDGGLYSGGTLIRSLGIRFMEICYIFKKFSILKLLRFSVIHYTQHWVLLSQMGGGILFFLVLPWLAVGADVFTISCVSWNVNSVAKIRSDPQAISQLTSCEVVFLQETLRKRAEDCLLLPGFVGQYSLAIPTARRPSRGVSSFFRIESFVDGSLLQVYCFCFGKLFGFREIC